MVDWGIARQIARFAARSDEVPELGLDMPALARELEGSVASYTGLSVSEPVPPVEVVSRVAWADANLDTLTSLLDPVAERLHERFASAGPFAGALRLGAGVTLATEVGLVTGYMSQRVLGQYELSLLAPEQPARVLLVAPNLERAAVELEADKDSFLRWVCVHCLLYTSDAADDLLCVDLGGRRI